MGNLSLTLVAVFVILLFDNGVLSENLYTKSKTILELISATNRLRQVGTLYVMTMRKCKQSSVDESFQTEMLTTEWPHVNNIHVHAERNLSYYACRLYDFHIKTTFSSSLPSVICWKDLLMLFVLVYVHSSAQRVLTIWVTWRVS